MLVGMRLNLGSVIFTRWYLRQRRRFTFGKVVKGTFFCLKFALIIKNDNN
jgi:hypothetical protein